MRYAIAPIALAAIANALPQGVTEAITPDTTAPADCSPDYSGKFQIQVVNVTSAASKRSFQKRQSGDLILTLAGGILTDAQGRTGYIADNRQFQFDAPAQTGAIYTAGWSVCSNGTLAIGGDAIFQQCLSGTFYNLYDEADEEQCSPVYIDVIGADSDAPAASVQPDGQPTASPVSQIADGQIQQPTGYPVNQIGDGQIQAATTTPKATAPIQQIGDGQIQAPTGAPISQIPDGQIQAGNATSVAKPTAPVAYTGAAALPTAHAAFGLAAGVLAIAML